MFSKKLLVIAVVALTYAQEQAKAPPPPPPVEIIAQQSLVRTDGYNFDFETSDGVSRNEEAQLITVGEHQGIGVKGSYTYPGPDGQQYMVTFTADDKGYRPEIHILPQGGKQ